MLVLALDTATPAVTAGVVRLDDAVTTLAQRVTVDARAHGELLVPHIQDVLADAGLALSALDAIVCGAGPGPFTGLRVGMVTAAALGHARDIPVYPVVTLDAIAADAIAADAVAETDADAGPLLVATDARRREVYWARYLGGPDGRRTDGPHVEKPAALAEKLPGLGVRRVAGQGGVMYAEVLGLPVVRPEFPSPAGLVTAGAEALRAGEPPAPLTPLYLRRPDAVELAHPKKVLR
ncbi:MAG TPA: tRNA (adenosine(37)-N6)-threonylcarbamoyltransferase complex dimerization subunit type 1 TsaB [Pseudonocardiaceae bacterium]